MTDQNANAAIDKMVPFGFYAVKDTAGRATGEVLPIPNVNDRSNSTPAQEPLTAAQIARNAEVRLLIEPVLRADDTDDQPIVLPKAAVQLCKQDVVNLMVPPKVETAALVVECLPAGHSELQPNSSW